MRILVLNSGASFIRSQLWSMPDETELLHGQALKIGLTGSCIDYRVSCNDYHHVEAEIRDHSDALRRLCCIFNHAVFLEANVKQILELSFISFHMAAQNAWNLPLSQMM